MSYQNDTTSASDKEHETPPRPPPLSLSGSTTAVPSLYGSNENLNGKQKDVEGEKEQNSDRPGFLDVPLDRPRRLSIQSTFSDLSELSYHPSRQNAPLMRTESNTSDSGKPQSAFTRRLRALWVQNYGALLVLCSQFFGCLMNLSTRLLETDGEHGAAMHPFQILFARQGITAAVCITYGMYSKSVEHFPLGPKGIRWLLVLRGIGGFFGVFGLYFSLLYLPLSEATVLTFLAPIIVCYVCSRLMTGESFTRQQQLAALVSLIGVVLIARPHSILALFFEGSSTTSPDVTTNSTTVSATPTSASPTLFPSAPVASSANSSHSQIPAPTSKQHLAAIGISMIGVFGATIAMTTIRAIGTRAHPFVSINYFSVWCTIVSLASLMIFPNVKFRLPGNLTEWGLLASLGACGFVMQWLLTEGLAYGSASNAKQPAISGREDLEADGDRRKEVGRHSTRPTKHNIVIKGAGTRATSMVYTQMLFALAGDKVVFGVTPTALSWVGSAFILAGAMWVAAARDQPPATSAADSLELNTVAGNAVGFGSVEASRPAKPSRTEQEDAVGLMDDVDGLKDVVSDDDDDYGGSPSSSTAVSSPSRRSPPNS
jgi:drug/metabolite transporter (DMT)-like permease